LSYIPILARVDSLPPLPESVILLEKLFSHGDPDIDDLVKIITFDPLLTADILAKVNAPYYGFSKKIVSVLQAVTLFGSTQIRAIILSSSIQKHFDIDLSPYAITTSDFSKISTMQSELIFQWYMVINIDMAREITPIAFLMEIGKILLAKDIIQKDKKDAFLKDLENYEDIAHLESIYSMMSTAEVSALIFQQLNLNDNFSESMRYLNNEKEIPEAIKETVFALQVVRKAINIKEQLTENSIANALDFLTENSYNTKIFKRVAQRLQRRYLA